MARCDPRHGGRLQNGNVTEIRGGGSRSLGDPPNEPSSDWAVLIRRAVMTAPASGSTRQTLDQPTRFLVKLGENVGSVISRVGDRVTAAVISPERFLGGRLEGAVDQASADSEGTLRFRFHTLDHNCNAYRVASTITGFVNSKGHRLVDEQERPVRVADGVLTSSEPKFTVDEGAEFQLQVVLSLRSSGG